MRSGELGQGAGQRGVAQDLAVLGKGREHGRAAVLIDASVEHACGSKREMLHGTHDPAWKDHTLAAGGRHIFSGT